MEIGAKNHHIPTAGNVERAASVIAGTMLAFYGTRKRSVLGVGMALAGAGLVRRGTVGCSFFGPGRHARIDRSVTINKPKEEVYSFWRDLANLPKFMCRLKSVKLTGPNVSHWVANAPGGKTVEWDAEIINEIENEVIAWRSMPGARFAHAGSVRFEDAAGERGSVVRVSISYNLPGGAAASAIAKLLGADPLADLGEDLRRLKSLLEAGQFANVEGQVSGKTPDITATKKEHEAKVQDASENSFPASDAPAYR